MSSFSTHNIAREYGQDFFKNVAKTVPAIVFYLSRNGVQNWKLGAFYILNRFGGLYNIFTVKEAGGERFKAGRFEYPESSPSIHFP